MRTCKPVQYNKYVETDYTSEGRKKYNMDTKDTAEKTAPSVAPAKPAPAPKPAGEPQPERPVPSAPSSGLGDVSLEGLGASFSAPSVGGPEGKEKEKEKEAADMGVEEENPGGRHKPSYEEPLNDRPVESALSASEHPAVPSKNQYTPSHTSSEFLTRNHSTYG